MLEVAFGNKIIELEVVKLKDDEAELPVRR